MQIVGVLVVVALETALRVRLVPALPTVAVLPMLVVGSLPTLTIRFVVTPPFTSLGVVPTLVVVAMP